jgi:hypothetical protein
MDTFLLLIAMNMLEATLAPPSIDTFCDPLAKHADRRENVPRIFADLSDHDTDKEPQWRPLKDKAELDRRATDDGVYTQAFVWKQPRGTFVLMYFTSPSGDWAEYGAYCYRADGSLARSVSTLNTFNVNVDRDEDAPVSRIRTKYLASSGRVLQSRTRVVNKKTGKPTKVSFMDQEEAVYRTLADLPFAALLR